MNTSHQSSSRRILASSAVALLALCVLSPSSRAGNTWDGGGATSNWSNAINWNPNGAPSYASELTFTGAVRTSNFNDATLTTAGIAFDAGASAFTLSGLAVTGTGVFGFTNLSAFEQTITFGYTLGESQTFLVVSNTLTLTGGIVKNGVTLTLDGTAGTVNINTIGISGAGANSDLIVDSVTANLNVANTYNGPTLIRSAGVINANALNALPTLLGRTALTMDDSGTGSSVLNLNSGISQEVASLTGAVSSIVNLGTSILTIGTVAGTTNFSGQINGLFGAGNVSIIKDGLSTQTFSGANTYVGLTNVNAGTLRLGNALALGSAGLGTNVASGATLDLNGQVIGEEQLVIAGAGTAVAIGALNNSSVSTATLASVLTLGGDASVGGSGNISLDGKVTGAFQLTKVGAGTLFLTSNANDYGQTTVSAGILEVQANHALGTVAAGTTVASGATLRLISGINLGTEALTLNGDGTGAANALGALTIAAGGTVTVGGPITVGSNATIHTNGGTIHIDGTIDKTSVNLTLTGGGTINVNGAIILSGAPAGFNDDLIVNGTTANLNNANTYLGTTFIRSVVAGDGRVNANVLNALPTINGRSAVVMDDAGAGSSVLNLSGSTGFPLGANQSVASLAGAASSVITLGANTLTIGFGTAPDTNGTAAAAFLGVIGGTGGVTKDQSSVAILSGLNTYTGATLVTGGTLQAGSTQAFGITSATTVGTGAVLDLAGNSNTIGSLADVAGVGGTVRSAGGAAILTTGSDTTSTSFAGVLENGAGGTLGLTKIGAGTQTLAGLNTYTGATRVTGGTLEAGSTQAFGVTSATTVGTGAILDLAGNSNTIGSLADIAGVGGTVRTAGGAAILTTGSNGTSTSFAGVLENGAGGNLSLTKIGAGTQTLAGVNTYTGATRVTGGTLRAGSTQAFGVTSATTVGVGAILDLAGNSNTIGSLADVAGVGGTVRSAGGAAALTTGSDGTSTSYAGLMEDGVGGELSLTKIGGGIQTLSGNNTYTGDTRLTEGGINADAAPGAPTNSALGLGTLFISGGTTLGSTVSDETISNDVEMLGSFTLAPAAGGMNLSGDIDLNAGGTMTNSTALGRVNFTGVVASGGGVAFAAMSSLGVFVYGDTANLLNPDNLLANTYSGLTEVTADTGLGLAKADGVTALPGDATVNAGGSIVLFSSNQIADTATLTVNSTGNSAFGVATGGLSLNGENETIGTLLGTGTVELDDLPFGGATAGTLTVGAGTFSGVIFDNGLNGQLVKNTAGTLILSGNNTYTGSTNIDGGILVINGSVRSSVVTINPNGTLMGTGTAFGNVTNAGNFSPGNSPGKFTIGGNYTQTAGGTLNIEIAGAAASQHDLVAVGKVASLAGNLKLISLNNFRPVLGDRITFLTAANGVVGKFGNVLNPFITGTIVEANIVYTATTVSLEMQQGSFGAYSVAQGMTPNQQSVAFALDKIAFDANQSKLIGYLDGRLLGNLASDFDLIAPEELQSIFTIGISQANIQTANLTRRMDDLHAGATNFSSAGLSATGLMQGASTNYLRPHSGANGPSGKISKDVHPVEAGPFGLFVTGSGEWAHVGSTDNASGYDLATGGFTIGLDYKVNSKFVIGINTGYARTSADLTANGNITVDGAKLGLYGTYFDEGFYLNGSAQGGYNSYDTKRGALQGTARGSTNGGEFNALIATGYDWKQSALTIGPVASVQYSNIGFKNFQESGSLAPLNFDSQSGVSLRTALGMRASYDCRVGGVVIRPEVRAAWQHEFGDTAYDISSSFSHGGANFTVQGAKIGRESVLVGAGVAILWNERTSTYVYYDGELGRTNYQSNNVSAGVRLEF